MRSDAVIGRTLAGRFRVTSFLGEGAMAAVYRGEQDEEPREVAIKVMHPHLAGDDTFPKRFRREAKAAKALAHPNVVRILDYGVDGDLAYIAMELLKGCDLFEVLEKRGKLPADVAGRIMIRVARALAAAHERGIVHRDLKPENVMIEGPLDGSVELDVKVLDFGVAKIVAPDTGMSDDAPTHVSGSGLTTAGAVLGTPEYMSPEQCQGAALDTRTDVYSAGVLLYQLVTGHVPFRGPSPVHTMLMHVRDAPAPPRQVVPDLDAEIETVIMKALAKPLADRWASAAALGEALSAVVARLDRERPPTVVEPVIQVTTKRTRVPRAVTEPLTPITGETPIVEITAIEAPDTAPGVPPVVTTATSSPIPRAVPAAVPSPVPGADAQPPPGPPIAIVAQPPPAPPPVEARPGAAVSPTPGWIAPPPPPPMVLQVDGAVAPSREAQIPTNVAIYVVTFVAVFIFVLGILSLIVFG